MSITRIMQQAASAGGEEALAIEDVFSTYLYQGNGDTGLPDTISVVNGVDLAGEGGLVWIKNRTDATLHNLWDTERGGEKYLRSNANNAEYSYSIGNNSIVYNSDGFDLPLTGANKIFNHYADTYVSWTFRKAPRFFDVVTYTGTGSARTVSHNLGVVPGCIIVKRTDTTGDWQVYHRSNTANPETDYLVLNTTAATADSNTRWNDTAPTDSVFTVGTEATVNASGGTYVAYLFAHDPLGPSGDGSDGLIACGSYTGDGTTDGSNQVTLGWEPQWLLVKRASGASGWILVDNMRGLTVDQGNALLIAQSSNAEVAASTTYAYFGPKPDGFVVSPTTTTGMNTSGETYIYIAIRRGPMRAPESGTDVFLPYEVPSSPSTGAITGFVTDAGFIGDRSGSDKFYWGTRLTGDETLNSTSTAAGSSNANQIWDRMDGWWNTAINNYMTWGFRRAPNFFDVVAYTGTGVARTVPHNLGVAPEMIIAKNRTYSGANWIVWCNQLTRETEEPFMLLNATNGKLENNAYWNNGAHTASVFETGSNLSVNGSGYGHIAYLFATLPGVSKVDSYTGNGTSQTIDCGFTSGARFILIKRTDSTGDWYVWDATRGIVAGNDPHMSLNSTAAEVTTDDSVDPDSSGFIVNQVAATNINVSSASYIFYAVA